EHSALYKLSITIDANRLGQDIWWADNYDPEKQEITFKYKEGNQEKELKKKVSMSGQPIISSSSNYEVKVDKGKITFQEFSNSSKYEVKFTLDPSEKQRRIRNILEAIKNGLYAQSSGEANTIVPLFLIAGAVKVPCPVFHPYIDIRKENGQWKVIGVSDALDNSWLEKDGNQLIVYIKDSERLRVDDSLKNRVLTNWNEFLQKVGLKD
ncbi:MAG: type I-B CRISPR-associated protein Cas7/Cst2/DevR, partial [Thermacetogeniaceae bacterium]